MQNNSYGKKPLWQWIVIYIVIAILLYGLVYYFFFAKKNIYNQTNTQPYQQNQPYQENPPLPVKNTNTPTTKTPVPSNISVSIKNFSFNPASITIHKGDTVTWTNNDSMSHTVTGDIEGPASSAISPGSTYSYTFTKDGTFSYHCTIHPSMKALIIVTN